MKNLLILTLALFLSGCASKDLFYTARPDISVTVYFKSDIKRKLSNYSDARYLYYYSDSDMHQIVSNALEHWADSLGYKLNIREIGEPTADDTSDYVVTITKQELTEQNTYKSVSQPTKNNSPKMSSTVEVRQVNVFFTAKIHSNLSGNVKVNNSYTANDEKFTAGYFEPDTPSTGSNNTPSYKYICDAIPMQESVSEFTTKIAVRDLVIRIDNNIRRDFRFRVKSEKRR
jgi:hypothetical protein